MSGFQVLVIVFCLMNYNELRSRGIYLGPCQISRSKFFESIVIDFYPFIALKKKIHLRYVVEV